MKFWKGKYASESALSQETPEGVAYFHSLKTFPLGYNVYLPVDHPVSKKEEKNLSKIEVSYLGGN